MSPEKLRFELLRAYPVGLESREHLAMRVVLSVSAGSEGALYPLGAGLLDEDEVPVLAAALSQMSKPMRPGADVSALALERPTALAANPAIAPRT